MCLSLSCLVDSVSGGSRQSFFIHPNVTDKRSLTESAAATTSVATADLYEQLSALESLLVRASQLSVEDKYSMNFRRTEEDYTLLGRGMFMFHVYVSFIYLFHK